MSQKNRQHLSPDDIEYVSQLARDGGELARSMRAQVGVRTKSGPRDFVTDADVAVSKLIVDKLSARFPDDLIVSEEDQKPGADSIQTKDLSGITGRCWLIDPIDGTENYINEDGQYSCMIAMVVEGAPYYGCLYQPSTNTLFAGGPDFGSFKQLNGEQPVPYYLQSTLTDLHKMRLMIGWGDRRKFPWIMTLPRIAYVPSDSMGLKIVKILENHADIFVSLSGKIKIWDTATPAAIAAGAGLEVGTASGQPLHFPLPHIHQGSSVIIGRPGSLKWAVESLHRHPHVSE